MLDRLALLDLLVLTQRYLDLPDLQDLPVQLVLAEAQLLIFLC